MVTEPPRFTQHGDPVVTGGPEIQVAVVVRIICPHCGQTHTLLFDALNYQLALRSNGRLGNRWWRVQCPEPAGGIFIVQLFGRTLLPALQRAEHLATREGLSCLWLTPLLPS